MTGEDEECTSFGEADRRAREITKDGGPVYTGTVGDKPSYEYYPVAMIAQVQTFREGSDE